MGLLAIACLAIYALVFIIAVGVGLWFLTRAWWRSLVKEKPDSRIVGIGVKMATFGRKAAAGIISIAVVCALCIGVSSYSNSIKAKNAKSETIAAAPETNFEGGDDRAANTMVASLSPWERVEAIR